MIRHILTLIWNKKRQNVLLFLEIFFAFLILFAVFTFVIYNLRLYRSPLGFDTKDMWIVNLNYDESLDSAAYVQTRENLKAQLNSFSEIESVAFSGDIVPFSGSKWSSSSDDNGFLLRTLIGMGDEDFLETMNMKLVEGRWFSEEDKLSKYPPVVISKILKDTYFKDQPVVDSIYHLDEEGKIIGVIENFKYLGEFSKEEGITFNFTPIESRESPNILLKIRKGTPASFEEKVNKVIGQITKGQDFIIQNLETSRKRSSQATWIPIIAMLSICGFLILNVALGLFGVLWYNIQKRKSEIGLRRTLGASQSEISFQFTAEVTMVAFLGILLGVFFSIQFPILKLLEIENINYYFGMLSAGILILILVVLCAFYPSRQASLIHPAIALHEE